MYSLWLVNLTFFFDLWGLCTEFKDSPRQLSFDRIIFVLHILLAIVFTVLTFVFLKRPVQDYLGIFNDSVKLNSMLLVYWLSILESYSTRRTLKKFWIIVQQIDQQFCSHQFLCFKSYFVKMITYFIFLIMFLLNYVWKISPNSDLHYFWFCFTSYQIYFNVRLFYYLFFLEFIKHELKAINQEVSAMLACLKRNKLRNAKDFIRIFHRNRFKWFRQYYGCVYELSNIINSVCGVINCAAIPLPFLLLLTDVNWFYWKILNMYDVDIIGK